MNGNALSAILAELRVSGAIVLSQAHPIPWSIRVPPGNQLRDYLEVGDDVTVVPFHIAHRGHFDLHPSKGEPIVVHANQLIMCANGHGHVMGSGRTTVTRSFEEIMSVGSFDTTSQSGVGHTEVVCGVFMLRNTRHNPLINALPEFVLLDINGSNSTATMHQLHRMLKEEIAQERQGRSYMLERVLELLYAESIRTYAESDRHKSASWLTAINDKRVGPALNYIHAHLGEALTVDTLAEQVALSPSRFAACFRELVGVSPKNYITSQRQAQAARQLVESQLPIQEIASQCGYSSIPSFSKSFLKQFGKSPSSWRREHASPK